MFRLGRSICILAADVVYLISPIAHFEDRLKSSSSRYNLLHNRAELGMTVQE